MLSEFVRHILPPVYASDSAVLILGTIPSPKSRELGFYYGHPQNRFWKTLAAVFDEPVPASNEEKKVFALRHRIALWDVLASCRIDGASDGSITDPVPNPVEELLAKTGIRAVFCTGKKAAALYRTYCLPRTGIEAVCLPSTSPANCAVSPEELVRAYRAIRLAAEG